MIRDPSHTAAFWSKRPGGIDELLSTLSRREAHRLMFEWRFWARDKQLPPPGDWSTWLIMAGRGFGKTRTGAEWCREVVQSGRCSRLALVARTASDVRDVVVEGESGLLAICPPWFYPVYNPSKRRVTWPNGAIATLYSADEPDLLRGPQHDGAWCDELAAWRYPDTWDMLMFGLRLGDNPQCVVTTTPRPTKLVRQIKSDEATEITLGTTYENAGHLAPNFFRQIVKKYEGTRLGRQELLAQLLDDNPDALWKRANIDQFRILDRTKIPTLKRIVVSVDPATTDNENSNETGIIVAGVDKRNHAYVLDDYTVKGTPDEWGSAAVNAYIKYHADRIVGEVNQGGQMVEHVIRTVAANRGTGLRVSYKAVRASRGKLTRAEPVSALYEQGMVHHVGCHAELEDQMCEWMPGEDSPDRMDSLVWGITELLLDHVSGKVHGA